MAGKEESNNKPIYKQWWLWLIVLVIVIAIVGIIGNKKTPIESIQERYQQEKTEYSIGEEAIWGDGAITVTNVEKSQGIENDKPSEGKEYVIVHVTIENKGESNLRYNPYYFKMQNSQGQQVNTTYTTVDQDTALHAGELIPGGKVTGTLTFEEPIDDDGLILVYNDNIWSSKDLTIKL